MAIVPLLAGFIFLAYLSENRAPEEKELPASPPTTAWPHGKPEYAVEVPAGYEDLLPGSGREEEKEKPRPTRRVPEPAAKTKPTLIFVIDDAGYNLAQLEPFLDLPFPVTIAVLPGVPHSAEAVARIIKKGKEAILHQPMEALGKDNPGPGAIMIGMDGDEAVRILSSNLDSLPGVVGVNNHMGSAVTRDPALMGGVLDLVKARGIYYLDSLTAPDTATRVLSAERSMPFWERDVFLDNSADRQSILHAIEEGKKEASSKGAAVLIGHVWSSELAQTLMDVYPGLVEDGYSLSTIARFMLSASTEDGDARTGD